LPDSFDYSKHRELVLQVNCGILCAMIDQAPLSHDAPEWKIYLSQNIPWQINSNLVRL